jgi:hypothetical protein
MALSGDIRADLYDTVAFHDTQFALIVANRWGR